MSMDGGDEVLLSLVQRFPATVGRKRSARSGDNSSTTSASSGRSLGGGGGARLEDEDATSDATSGDGEQERPQRAKKPRKPSHVMIREEKELLRKELAALEARAAVLRRRAGLPGVEELEQTKEVARQNLVLVDALRAQEQLLADAHAAFSEFMLSRASNPLEGFVHLGRGMEQRSATVMRLKDETLARADRFLEGRLRHVNVRGPGSHHEQTGATNAEGDYTFTLMDTTRFRGVNSVREVFRAMQFYFLNLEITNSELTGNISIREDDSSCDVEDDDADMSIQVHRLVTKLSTGVIVEKNALKFLQLFDNDDPVKAFALMSSVPINRDDLLPYSPSERLRIEMFSAMKLSAFYESEPDSSTPRLTVTMSRWFRVELHQHSSLDIPDHALLSARRAIHHIPDPMLTSMHQTLYGSSSPPSSS